MHLAGILRLSVPAWAPSSKPATAGPAGRRYRSNDVWRTAVWRVNVGSATLSAYVGS